MNAALSQDADVAPYALSAKGDAGGHQAVALLLRGEALLELALVLLVYRHVGGGWTMFAVVFLLPDLSMLGYAVNRRVGTHSYNLAHTYIAPGLLALAAFVLAAPLMESLALIWAAHIGFDRAVGYGLKYPAAFGATHLGGKHVRG